MVQPTRRAARRSGGLGSDPYAGYGINLPGSQCPPRPEDALIECIRAMQQILKDTLQISDLAPWIHPPFRARSFSDFTRTIVSTTVALNAGVNAAGVALQAANTVPGAPALVPALEEMSAAGEFQTIFEFSNPINVATRVSTWGITVNNVVPEGVLIKVSAGSVAGGPPSAPNPLLSSAEFSSHEPVFLLVQGKQTVQIQVALRDVTGSPAVIDFGITAWSWPVRNRDDSPEGLISRSGYGLDCS